MGRRSKGPGPNFLKDCASSRRQVPPKEKLQGGSARGLFNPEHLGQYNARVTARRGADRVDRANAQGDTGVRLRRGGKGYVPRPPPQEFYEITILENGVPVRLLYPQMPIPRQTTCPRTGRSMGGIGKTPKKKREAPMQDATGAKMVLNGIGF